MDKPELSLLKIRMPEPEGRIGSRFRNGQVRSLAALPSDELWNFRRILMALEVHGPSDLAEWLGDALARYGRCEAATLDDAFGVHRRPNTNTRALRNKLRPDTGTGLPCQFQIYLEVLAGRAGIKRARRMKHATHSRKRAQNVFQLVAAKHGLTPRCVKQWYEEQGRLFKNGQKSRKSLTK